VETGTGTVGAKIEIVGEADGVLVRIVGQLDRHVSADVVRQIVAAKRRGPVVWLDLSGVVSMDSVGASVLDVACRKLRQGGQQVRLRAASEAARSVMQTVPSIGAEQAAGVQVGLFEQAGKAGYDWFAAAGAATELLGEVFARGVLDLFRRRFPSFEQTAREAIRIGVDAFPVVSLIGLLLGLILGFQAAHQLRQFGADIFVADLVALGIVREFGPLMTAIIVAGRSGSSIAAELGTMVVREEVDALKTMGVDPVRYLVVPKFYAITIVGPALAVYCMLLGILGGLFIAVTFLDLAPGAYWSQTQSALGLSDMVQGVGKALVFSWIVVMVSTYQGLNISGGAVGVGRATTSSVVASIFLIIVADSIITTAFTVLG
jgi:phospholipid/cholesterol/gamma-HCH transport system permease protein